jgi:hypothetical protein
VNSSWGHVGGHGMFYLVLILKYPFVCVDRNLIISCKCVWVWCSLILSIECLTYTKVLVNNQEFKIMVFARYCCMTIPLIVGKQLVQCNW